MVHFVSNTLVVCSQLQEVVCVRVDWHGVSVQVDDRGPILNRSGLNLKNEVGTPCMQHDP